MARHLLTMLLTLLPCVLTLAQPAQPVSDGEVLTIRDAQVSFTLDGATQASQSLELPLHWDVLYPDQAGMAELTLQFGRPARWAREPLPYMLFTPRIGNAYAIALNGVVLATAGALDDPGSRWSSKHPVGITFPANLLGEDNTLTISLRADIRRNAGLAPLIIGPLAVVEPLRAQAYDLRVTMAIVCVLISVLVAGFCLLLWLQQRESLFAWAAAGEAMWAIVVADVYWETLPLRWPAWMLALPSLRAVWVWVLYAITEQVFGVHPARERRLMHGLILLMPLSVATGLLTQSYFFFGIVRIALWLLFVWMLARIAWSLRRHHSSERLLLAMSLGSLLLLGAVDETAERFAPSGYASIEWAKYSGSMLAVTIMWIVSKRFRHARTQALRLQASLEQRVARKEQELRESFTLLSQTEQARAVVAERERILRDMHDGVGANLATAMRQLESGTAPNSDVVATLQESLLHLKLSIDAMNLPTGDINSLLASLRYRLQPRIESVGLTLLWQVDLLPRWVPGNDQMMRHLQFLVLEAISNVLQHAGATTLTIGAHVSGSAPQQTIEIVLSDDGKGIGDAADRGLSSIKERAKAIGAHLAIEQAVPGTRLTLRLPL